MNDLATGLPARLAAALVGLVPGCPDAFDELRELYADDVVFRDPLQEGPRHRAMHGVPKLGPKVSVDGSGDQRGPGGASKTRTRAAGESAT
jgi:hypothetical protein